MSQHDNTHTNFQQQKKLKKITRGQLQDNLRNFAQEFQNFDPQVTVSTPQADRGIGPVQYTLKLPSEAQISIGILHKLNKVIELEKSTGDELIKFDASLLFLASGKEDPKGFLPPGCRAAIRTEIQE
jgi:hypothetical protein